MAESIPWREIPGISAVREATPFGITRFMGMVLCVFRATGSKLFVIIVISQQEAKGRQSPPLSASIFWGMLTKHDNHIMT